MCFGSSTIRRAGSSGRQLGGSKTWSSGRRTTYPMSDLLLEAAASRAVDVRAVAGDRREAGGRVEADRLVLQLAGLEPQRAVAERARLRLEGGQDPAADTVAACIRDDVHAPELGRLLVVAADAAAA